MPPKSPSAGMPEITPVCASMWRPAGKVAENVRASSAAGATKWLETFRVNGWPSLVLWSAIATAVAVGPLLMAVGVDTVSTGYDGWDPDCSWI